MTPTRKSIEAAIARTNARMEELKEQLRKHNLLGANAQGIDNAARNLRSEVGYCLPQINSGFMQVRGLGEYQGKGFYLGKTSEKIQWKIEVDVLGSWILVPFFDEPSKPRVSKRGAMKISEIRRRAQKKSA